jgi:hypothetical protein
MKEGNARRKHTIARARSSDTLRSGRWLCLDQVPHAAEYAPASWLVGLSIGPVKPSCLKVSSMAARLVTADGRMSEQVGSLTVQRKCQRE